MTKVKQKSRDLTADTAENRRRLQYKRSPGQDFNPAPPEY